MFASTRCGASSLPEALLTSLLEKVNYARRFEEKPYFGKLHMVGPLSLAPERKMRRIEFVESSADVAA